MRLWSINPAYLDGTGLVALWRESLLAQKVLAGLTRGYKNHPQLFRFRTASDPILAVGCYLSAIEKEARLRGYRFDVSRITSPGWHETITVRHGQVEYEWKHLMEKLAKRAPDVYRKNRDIVNPAVHILFKVVPGGTEVWEKITK